MPAENKDRRISSRVDTSVNETPYGSYIEQHGIVRELPYPARDTKLSIVIPTLNERELILRPLRSLNKQTNLNFEVVIADNGSTDGTQEIVDDFAQDARYPLYRLDQPKKGVGYARKRGMDQAVVRQLDDRGIRYIGGTDADTHVPAEWVDKVYQRFADKDVDLLAGKTQYYGTNILNMDKLVYLDDLYQAIFQRIRPRLLGTNFIMTTDMYVATGGMPQPCSRDGKPVVGEDLILGRKVLEVGGKVDYFPIPIHAHPRRQIKEMFNIMQDGGSPYPGGDVTQIRNAHELVQAYKDGAIPDEYIDRFKNLWVKHAFRYIINTHRKEAYRKYYWEKAKEMLYPFQDGVEAELMAHDYNTDALWEKYGEVFLVNAANLLEENKSALEESKKY